MEGIIGLSLIILAGLLIIVFKNINAKYFCAFISALGSYLFANYNFKIDGNENVLWVSPILALIILLWEIAWIGKHYDNTNKEGTK